MSANSSKIDCAQCQHYYVTWDADRPHGCKYFAFKSPQSPALAVIESSGQSCQAFSAKANAHNQQQKPPKKGGWVA
jgi:pyridoxine/pyridoxamine 5'-phosphate oxidase